MAPTRAVTSRHAPPAPAWPWGPRALAELGERLPAWPGSLLDRRLALSLAFAGSRPGRALAWVSVGLVCLLVGGLLKLPEAVQTPGSDTGMFAT
jgi:hypothetical protein